MAARPDTNAVRRSDPSPNESMDPVSLMMICACSSAWHNKLPAGAENPDAQGEQADALATALAVPGGHGVHDAFLAAPAEKEAAGQSPEGEDRPAELQCFPGEQGEQLDVEAMPGEKEPKGQSPLAAESP